MTSVCIAAKGPVPGGSQWNVRNGSEVVLGERSESRHSSAHKMSCFRHSANDCWWRGRMRRLQNRGRAGGDFRRVWLCASLICSSHRRVWNAGCLIGPKAPMKPKCSYSNSALQATCRIASIQRAKAAVLLGGAHQICSVCESARRIYGSSSSAADARVRLISVVCDIKPEQHSPNDAGLPLSWVGLILAYNMQDERLPSR